MYELWCYVFGSFGSGLFVKTAVLQTLVLARNRLGESVFASLQAVTSLRALDLSFNTLRDSCGSTDDTARGIITLPSRICVVNTYAWE